MQTTWRLLDYIAVDYREAVRGGRIVNPAEYREMEEFSASVSQRLAALPDKQARAALLAGGVGVLALDFERARLAMLRTLQQMQAESRRGGGHV